MALVLRPYQNEIKSKVYQAWENGHKNVLLVLPTGGGKCLGRNTPVLLYNGTIKNVQDIVVGDKLMGPDSKPRVVLSTCTGRSKLHRIIPVKGEPWICNDVHILSLRETGTKKTLDIPINEYLEKNKNFKHLHKQFRVGVKFKKAKTKFDPYLVGLYLAEGTYSSAHITTPEPEIINYLEKWCKNNKTNMSIRLGSGCFEIGFSSQSRKHGSNLISILAKSCSSINDRKIPKEYLINSREIRLKTLAGLIDGDGYVHNNCIEIITKYPSLNKDILFLARSLGFAAYSSKKIGTIKEINFKGEYFRISISGKLQEIPTIVKRKKLGLRQQIKDVLNTGFKVEDLPVGDYYGFELNGDGRFLLGDFTVTHNTKTFCSITIDKAVTPKNKLSTAIMVHRKELLQQISITLAEEGIKHNIIAQRKTILGIVAAHRRLFNRQFYDYGANITVVSVDTLNSRILKHEQWAKSIQFWITDEAAHLLKDNKWGRAVSYFNNAIGLGVTATPQRLDRRGLGSHADGIFDVMVKGPDTKWMIDNKFLCEYKIAVPESDYENYLKTAGENSDFTREAMQNAAMESHIIGDAVANYLKFADGKQAIYFCSDITSGGKMEQEFNKQGIPAKLLTGTTSDEERLQGLIDFKEKKIRVLLNVDLFDEGLDVPGIEVVGMCRPTMSLGKYLQMIGRGLRPHSSKPHLILIDHVGNVKRHGLPDSHRYWTLDRISKKKKNLNLIRICENPICNSPFDRILTECPYCGTPIEKTTKGAVGSRTPLEQVDGDLFLLDRKTLLALEAQTKLEDPAAIAERVQKTAGAAAGLSAAKKQMARIESQRKLIDVIAKFAGTMRHTGLSDRSIHKKFYLLYGKSITEALGEPREAMDEMIKTIQDDFPATKDML